MHLMSLNLGARAFVVTACWWRARCKSLRDIGAPPQHAISHRSQAMSVKSSVDTHEGNTANGHQTIKQARQASKQEKKQASKQANKQTSKQANKQASKSGKQKT